MCTYEAVCDIIIKYMIRVYKIFCTPVLIRVQILIRSYVYICVYESYKDTFYTFFEKNRTTHKLAQHFIVTNRHIIFNFFGLTLIKRTSLFYSETLYPV